MNYLLCSQGLEAPQYYWVYIYPVNNYKQDRRFFVSVTKVSLSQKDADRRKRLTYKVSPVQRSCCVHMSRFVYLRHLTLVLNMKALTTCSAFCDN